MVRRTKTSRVVDALETNDRISLSSIVSRFKFASRNAATGVISKLRDEGYRIQTDLDAKGHAIYSIY